MIGGYDSLAIQKYFVAAYFVSASTVPVRDCQNATAVRQGIDPKIFRSSARGISRTRKEGLHVYAGRVARDVLSIGHACRLSVKKAGDDEVEEDDNKPIRFESASSERFNAHLVEDTIQE